MTKNCVSALPPPITVRGPQNGSDRTAPVSAPHSLYPNPPRPFLGPPRCCNDRSQLKTAVDTQRTTAAHLFRHLLPAYTTDGRPDIETA